MIAIDSEGDYKFVEGTKQPLSSKHPVYEARVDIALARGSWLYAPDAGHELARFSNAPKTDAKVEEFQKELTFYLREYDPTITQTLIARNAVSMNLQIAEDVLNV